MYRIICRLPLFIHRFRRQMASIHMIGEGAIDLGKYYRKAYKRNVAIKLFETKKGIV